MSKWNLVSDKMPNEQDSVLLKSGEGHGLLVEAWYDDTQDEWVCFDDKFSVSVTAHDEWMDLDDVGGAL